MVARVGAIHLGWDVLTVAAGGGDKPIRPVTVEGSFTTPAYLLADRDGQLHTSGVERSRPDLGVAIADVRDILGYPQIVVAGATWPASAVYRARLFNPMAAIAEYFGGPFDALALPYPDSWPEEKVDTLAYLVETLGLPVEPLPESVAVAGYVRAMGLVGADNIGDGMTAIYSDGRAAIAVAVHADEERPTESADVDVPQAAQIDSAVADAFVQEALGTARSMGANTANVVLMGNVCFNDPVRLAFQNHLGRRLTVSDHPVHSIVLGAASLLVTEDFEPEPVGTRFQPPAYAPAPRAQSAPSPMDGPTTRMEQHQRRKLFGGKDKG